MLAASASLNLIALGAPRARQLSIGLIVLGMLFCESRVLLRVGRTDRRPAEQTFLLSLKTLNIPAGSVLHAAFPLSHSERFILQVVDGFHVEENSALSAAPGDPQLATGWQLVLQHGWTTQSAGEAFSGDSVLAAGCGYLLLRDGGASALAADAEMD
jgi:hypothetical protein